jgi:CubicO group peptidase (beta-lactamase class C family)
VGVVVGFVSVLSAAELDAAPQHARAVHADVGPAPTSPSPHPADSADAFPSRPLELLVQSEMARLGIPGLTAALATDLQLRWTAGFGLADLENAVAATPDTVYRLGSISKPITAVAVMQLSERARLDLDLPVQRYVPAFGEKEWPVTSRQLLAHLGGVRHYAPGEFEQTRHYSSLGDSLAIFAADPLVHEPETRFLYSTYGYNLLGSVVEAASGAAFLDYLEQNVFEPAAMAHTQADDVFRIIPHRARGYQRGPGGDLLNSSLADTSHKIPGGGLCGTAADAVRFACALQAGILLQKGTFEQMLVRQKTRDRRLTGYGLGWTVGRRAGQREAWHTGGQQRVSTVLYMQPDRRLAVAVLANLEGVQPDLLELARRIADAAPR